MAQLSTNIEPGESERTYPKQRYDTFQWLVPLFGWEERTSRAGIFGNHFVDEVGHPGFQNSAQVYFFEEQTHELSMLLQKALYRNLQIDRTRTVNSA